MESQNLDRIEPLSLEHTLMDGVIEPVLILFFHYLAMYNIRLLNRVQNGQLSNIFKAQFNVISSMLICCWNLICICRPFWLVASFLNLSETQQTTMIDVTAKSEKNILLLDKCPKTVANRLDVGVRCAYRTTNIYEYKTVYVQSQFCLVSRSERLFQLNFIEALASNCIPVIYADNSVLPFDEVFEENKCISHFSIKIQKIA